MKISIDWLNQYLDRAVDAAEADAVLTNVGFPIDGTEQVGDDTIIDVEVTSNRGDCLSHIGVAREIATATGRKLQSPTITLPVESGAVGKLTNVTNEAPAACPVYTARVITGVKIGPSPAWLQRHLLAVGLRSINNVVDITNFVLHELGQPLHAFDMKRLAEQRIVVRKARAGEPFTAIDKTRHPLRADMLVIADAEKPVALAGIMGGLDSEVTDATTDILLESAAFDPLSIRTTSRALKLASDSSYRFERGTALANVERASQRAAQLIVELAGGTLVGGVIRVGENPSEPPELKRVAMRPARCHAMLGHEVPINRMMELLAALELEPKISGERIECVVPSHRLDLEREIDLIEEVARLAGYEAIPMREKMPLIVRPPQAMVLARHRVGQVLVAHGYHETITFSNIAPKLTQPFIEPGHEVIMLDDERKAAEPALRTSLLPSLLSVRKTNQDAGNTNVKLFEVARVFSKKDGRFAESKDLAILTDAPAPGSGGSGDAGSLRDLRGTIEELLESLGCEAAFIEAGKCKPAWAETAGLIMEGPRNPKHIIGVIGVPTRAVTDLFDLKTQVHLAWLDYATISSYFPRNVQVQPLAKFPGIERDLSVIVEESATWDAVENAAAAADPELLERVQFMGVYRGRQIGPGKKSVTLRMTFRDPGKTLRHDQVDPQVNKVVAQLQASLRAELRVA
ncbi:MAG: phenylalanine--tRNA ligase subunit beta [Phycisphaerales bacterium]